MIEAFQEHLQFNQQVQLIIKTMNVKNREFGMNVSAGEYIVIQELKLSKINYRVEYISLLNRIDCVVSLHRARV